MDSPELRSYGDVVRSYLADYAKDAKRELDWFGDRPKTLSDAIERACLSRIPSGRGGGTKRHPHQCWLLASVLKDAARALGDCAPALKRATDFAAVFGIVEGALAPIRGVGPLAIYDIAHRVGAFLGFEPAEIYLHRGTRAGARMLGLPVRGRKSIAVAELPSALRPLTAEQCEDVLCIYRTALARIAAGLAAKAVTRRSCS